MRGIFKWIKRRPRAKEDLNPGAREGVQFASLAFCAHEVQDQWTGSHPEGQDGQLSLGRFKTKRTGHPLRERRGRTRTGRGSDEASRVGESSELYAILAQNIVTYICGWVVKKILKSIKCDECRFVLGRASAPEPGWSMDHRFRTLHLNKQGRIEFLLYQSDPEIENLNPKGMTVTNNTQYRGSMNVKTLQALTTRKQSLHIYAKPCFKQAYSKGLLKKAKRATYQKLNNS
ncbi:hypothetical protein CAPTEDRAFT_204418 [Capitella teleta]|uniref:Uncharacterized protein n=1 Tax=Capitella teleta TaxID=283909 RepID=R7T7X7_CAPTE|nr:hypothetical protein CAPTEDRAFT_204418 [Capitella teleta]|eukprot:ELT87530.1 hypothetical protein CAPTEDRAFT_204418 [Capitella teleta]